MWGGGGGATRIASPSKRSTPDNWPISVLTCSHCPLQVDIIFQGHEHSYARTCPMHAGACTSQPIPPGTAPLHPFLQWARGVARAVTGALRLWVGRAGAQAGQQDSAAPPTYRSPAGAPIYLLAGHGGAGVSTMDTFQFYHLHVIIKIGKQRVRDPFLCQWIYFNIGSEGPRILSCLVKKPVLWLFYVTLCE